MLEKIIIFVIFLAPLIFFHELGHFFFARFFGVRVEVFSIGFGPKIFKYVRKGTEYAVSIIPLGGYVKMFGDDPFSEVQLTEEEKKVAFNHKSKQARFWIVFGGPLANLILAYFLYVGLLGIGEKVPETKVGVVSEKSFLYQKGLRTGDILVSINDDKVTSFDDLNISGSTVNKISVHRGDQTVDVPVGMQLEPFIKELVSAVSLLKKPILVDKNGARYFISLTKDPADSSISLEELNTNFQDKFWLYKISEDNQGKITRLPDFELELLLSKGMQLEQFLKTVGYYPLDLMIKNIVLASPAAEAGLNKGDILLSLDDVPLKNFEQLRDSLQVIPDGKQVILGFLRNGTLLTKALIPEVRVVEKKKVKILGIESAIEYVQPKLITARAESFTEVVSGAFVRTCDGVIKTFSGYKKLITREVSLDNIGGPLAIGKVASDSFNISLSMFFRLMALISINLGVINLFPIPVLDGGHIMFLILETLNGGPLSRRKLEVAQRFGIAVLFTLIFVALFNDISKLF